MFRPEHMDEDRVKVRLAQRLHSEIPPRGVRGGHPAYNAQAMVSPVKTGQETSGMLVTAVEVVDEPADYTRLIPMLQRASEMTGIKAPLTLADAGYHSAAALQGCADRGQTESHRPNETKEK